MAYQSRGGSGEREGNYKQGISQEKLLLYPSCQEWDIDLGERMVFTVLSLPKDVKNSFL